MRKHRRPNRQRRGPRATITRPYGPEWPCGSTWEHAPGLCSCFHDRKECPCGTAEHSDPHWAYTCPCGSDRTGVP